MGYGYDEELYMPSSGYQEEPVYYDDNYGRSVQSQDGIVDLTEPPQSTLPDMPDNTAQTGQDWQEPGWGNSQTVLNSAAMGLTEKSYLDGISDFLKPFTEIGSRSISSLVKATTDEKGRLNILGALGLNLLSGMGQGQLMDKKIEAENSAYDKRRANELADREEERKARKVGSVRTEVIPRGKGMLRYGNPSSNGTASYIRG